MTKISGQQFKYRKHEESFLGRSVKWTNVAQGTSKSLKKY